MTIQELKLFLAVHKYMNFSIAAYESDISQSSLSKHIKSLEQELYVNLFDRSTRKIAMTPAGQELLSFAQNIVDEYELMITALKSYSGGKKAIRLKSIPVLSQYDIADMIAAFEKKYPNLELHLIEKDTKYVMHSLESPDTDLVIVRTGMNDLENYVCYPLLQDELCLVTRHTHPLAKYQKVNLREARDEEFILLDANSRLVNYCQDICLKAGFIPKTKHIEIRLETIHHLIKKDMGVSLMMRKVAEYFNDPEIKIISLVENPVLPLSLVTHKGKQPPEVRTFIEFALNYYGVNKREADAK